MVDHFIESNARLHCEAAAAALILLDGGRYVLQLRDNIASIFFPGYWGLFGGAIQAHETPLEALKRELQEELSLDIADSYFTRIEFDLSFIGRASIPRWFYVVTISAERYGKLRLGEGAALGAFTATEALTTLRLIPYDAFALWIHWSRARLT